MVSENLVSFTKVGANKLSSISNQAIPLRVYLCSPPNRSSLQSDGNWTWQPCSGCEKCRLLCWNLSYKFWYGKIIIYVLCIIINETGTDFGEFGSEIIKIKVKMPSIHHQSNPRNNSSKALHYLTWVRLGSESNTRDNPRGVLQGCLGSGMVENTEKSCYMVTYINNAWNKICIFVEME